MEARIRRKIVWENKGVSEIVGTILMLSITVVLFSTIITWVGQLPPPRESFTVDLKGSIEPVNTSDWSQGVFVNIRHEGGQTMDEIFVKLYLTVDTVTLTLNVMDGGAYMVDGYWSVGEVWRYYVDSTSVPSLQGPEPSSVFSILIINEELNKVIWSDTLGEGENYFAPIILDIWIDSDLGTLDVLDPGPISYTDPFKVYARITDPEGFDPYYGLNQTKGAIWVNMSSIGLSDHVNLTDVIDPLEWPEFSGQDALHDNIYVAICDPPDVTVNPGYYYFTVHAEDLTQPTPMSTERDKLFPVGLIVGDNPQIIVKAITFSDAEPVNGNTITIYATIWNQGLGGSRVDVMFYDESTGHTVINPGNESVLISVSALGEAEARIEWQATPGGVHVINVTAMVNASETVVDPFLDDNYLEQPLTVMPKILLVDDDGALNDKSTTDTVAYMHASLEAADFDYDFTIVGAGDGPGYDYGDYPLKDYDVVIWAGGYDYVETLTDNDMSNLAQYLQPGPGINGGSLWFISQGFYRQAYSTKPSLLTWSGTYLHMPLPAYYPSMPTEMHGNETHPVASYLSDNPMDIVDRVISPDPKYAWTYSWQVAASPNGSVALNDSSNTDAYALTYDSDEDLGSSIEDSRIYVQPWDFSRIRDTSDQAQYTYRVIMWLGNITMKFSKDVAISEQTIEPTTVFFKQNVTIRFIIRNNGFDNYTTEDRLYYKLRITDLYGQVDLVEMVYEQIDFLGSGNNNTYEVVYNWVPQEIGYHRLIIKVDPDNYIFESNEMNNEISNYLTSGELNVQYRILVVDDDSSPNNGPGTNYNETYEVAEALNYLNATGNYQFETFVVDDFIGGHGPDFELGYGALSMYNAVLWVTGEASATPLTLDDKANITEYLNVGGSLWLIGDGLWSSGDSTDTFDQNYLKVDSVVGDQGTPTVLRGPRGDDVSHGMEYNGIGGSFGDVLVPTPQGAGFFYQDDAQTVYNSVRFAGAPSANSSVTYKVATTSWLLSSLDNDENKAELVFMMLRWFGKPEDRIEARVTNLDVYLNDAHPQLGSGYVIQSTISNPGGAIANVLVRFMDGNTQIGSDSISVSPGGTTTAEIVWVPLFAGQRTLHIQVDPIAEVDEIFEWSNNNATMDIYVYFFWDDMESGTGKWSHSSTILLINGEEPIEYFYDTELDTDILVDWDYLLSVGVQPTDNDYHTYDTCFWLQEPPGGASEHLPIAVVMTMDSSGSMDDDGWDPVAGGNQPITDAKNAAKSFLNNLGAEDMSAVYDFDDDVVRVQDYTYDHLLSQAAIDGLNAGGMTELFDATIASVNYANSSSNPTDIPIVIVLTDGDDTASENNLTVANQTVQAHADPLLDDYVLVYTIGLGTGVVEADLMALATNWSCYYYAPTSADLDDIYNQIFQDIIIQLEGENQTRSGGGMVQPMDVATYTMVGVTQWGGPHDVYFCDVDDMPPVGANLNWWFEFDNQDYDQVEFSEDWRTASMDPQAGDEVFTWCDMVINENPTTVTQIDMTMEIQGNAATDFQIWAYNQVTSTWSQIGLAVTVGADTDITITRSITTNCADYISDSGDATVTWGCYQVDSSDLVRVDYIEMVITFTPDITAPTILATSPADGANNVAQNAQILVTFSERMNQGSVTYSCNPNPGGWTMAWESGDTVLRLSHNDFILETDYTFEITAGTDYVGNALIPGPAPNPWDFTTVPDLYPPYIVSTSPFDGETGVALTAPVVITFNETVNTSSFAFNCTPDPGGWTIGWSAGDTVVTLSHSNFAVSTWFEFNVSYIEDLAGNSLVPGPVWNPWWFESWIDSDPPIIIATTPNDGQVNVAINQPVKIRFSEEMNVSTVSYSISPTISGWIRTWGDGNKLLSLTHNDFDALETYTFTVTQARDVAGNALMGGAVANPFTFTTGEEAIPQANFNKTAVTETMNLEDLESAKLSFWHKYNMMPGANGGFLQVGYKNTLGQWQWKYVIPANAYTGNLRASVIVLDSFGQRVFWCWNGVSGEGTFDWDPVSVELLNYVPATARSEVKVKFNYTQYGGGTGYGWYLDDIRVTVTRSNAVNPVDPTVKDVWNLTDLVAHSGNYSWANFDGDASAGNLNYGYMKPGIDNYLKSMPIDLTNAKEAYLSAYVRFNLNEASGAPPDGFRIEVTQDNGLSWEPINLGVRSSWGVSGTGLDSDDGILDGLTYTGLPDSGNPGDAAAYNYWVEVGTLTRVKVDLSSYSGNAIQIRFRVVTCNHPSYLHYNHYLPTVTNPGFGGLYVDDVIVTGETIVS